jgi:hypothetical protein
MKEEKVLEAEMLIRYLAVLQDGRAIPDKHGRTGTVRESMGNKDEIEQVKGKINSIIYE